MSAGRPVQAIRKLIHRVDPYEGFDSTQRPVDLQGWGGHPEFFSEMVNDCRAATALEIGSWKGRSAAAIAGAMASMTRTDGIAPELVCVDTWLGATEFYGDFDDPTRYGSLDMRNGYPGVYYQFLTNMERVGLSHVVTPFAQTSTNALRFFKGAGVKFDLIYIDGSHEFEDVLSDIQFAWPLLNKGGIMVGDDYCDHWQGVKDAVQLFFNGVGIQHRQYPGDKYPSDYWIVRNS